jgi:hypothetical protein
LFATPFRGEQIMSITSLPARRFVLFAACVVLGACSNDAAVAPRIQPAASTLDAARTPAVENSTLATLRRVTARYHRLDAAIADGFVFLHGCEVRSDEGPVGTVYINVERLLDGAVDPSLPDGLIYEPRGGLAPQLVGVELAVPYALWTEPQAPQFLGASFQREDEFGVFGLHVWLWRNNPEGLFAEANPNVSCGTV